MGSFFTDVLSFKHETAVFDVNPQKLRFMYNCYRFTKLEEIEEFRPELVINAATVKYTSPSVFPSEASTALSTLRTGLRSAHIFPV